MADVKQFVSPIEQGPSIDGSTLEGVTPIEALEGVALTVVAGAALAWTANRQEKNINEFVEAGCPPEDFMKGFGLMPLQLWGPLGATHLVFKGAKAAAGFIRQHRS